MQNLWKKESVVHESNFVDLFAYLGTDQYDELAYQLQQGKAHKDNDLSIAYRLQGNDLFRENEIVDAMERYNKSLCYAEIGTENLSMVYANRSSCFLALKMYAEALIDIDLAVSANYPDRLMPKLMKRQANCIRLMQVAPERQQFQPKLCFEQHEQYPCLANLLQIKTNETYGRHIIATQNIDVGKIILVEQCFGSVSVDDERMCCAMCMKTKTNLIACSKCTDAMYCNNDCMERDAAAHKFSCAQFNSVSGSLKLYIKTLINAISLFKNVDSLMEFVAEAVESNGIPESMMNTKSIYRLFLSLNVSFNELEKDDLMFDAQKIYITIQSAPAIKQLFDTLSKQRFLQHLVLHHLLVTALNRFQISADGDYLETTEIAPMTCIFNHSCAPNAFIHVIGNQSVIITIRPVKRGDQLFISYLGEDVVKSTDFRRNYLMNTFGFLCECDKCESCCLPVDRAAMKMDKYFKCIQQDYKTAFNDKIQRVTLKDYCIRFLMKYGHLNWCDELNFVSMCYMKWIFEYLTEDFDCELSLVI